MAYKVKRISDKEWRSAKLTLLIERDGLVCQGCRTELTRDDATIDHLIPLSRCGTNKLINLQILCVECNNAKGNEIVSKGARIAPRKSQSEGTKNSKTRTAGFGRAAARASRGRRKDHHQ